MRGHNIHTNGEIGKINSLIIPVTLLLLIRNPNYNKLLLLQIIARIYKASKNYEKWKSSHNPHFKPWLYPEQMTLPRLDMSQIKPLSAGVSSESIDESGVGEEEIDEDDI